MASDLNEERTVVDNVAQVKRLAEERVAKVSSGGSTLTEKPAVELKEQMIRNVLKVELGMKFKKI